MRRFSFKTFTSFLLVLTFLSLALSGVMLFLSPTGRVAHWTNWTLLGLGKEEWVALHILMAIVFLTGSLFHLLKFNWKVFLHYLRTKRRGFQHKKELLASICLFSVVLIGTLIEVSPFVSVMAVHEKIKVYWEDETGSPPVAHMELLSLTEVASSLQMTKDQLVGELEKHGLSVGAKDQTLKQVADSNGHSPQAIFRLLQQSPHYAAAASVSDAGLARRGLGKRTLEEIAGEMGMSTSAAINILAERAVDAGPDERIRDIAARSKRSPHELLEVLREGVVSAPSDEVRK